VGVAISWWWQNIASGNDYPVYTALGAILGRSGWGQGSWSNILFRNQSQQVLSLGQKGPHESLLYVVAANAAFPTGGTNVSLPTQTGKTITLSNWPSGVYYADWYDPASAQSLGRTSGMSANGQLTLALPNYSVDLAGIVYPPPNFAAPVVNANGGFQCQFNSENGGVYTIEGSSDLRVWTPLTAVTNFQGTTLVSVPLSTAQSIMFLRARRDY
jgi:hypothetical protein